MTLNSIVKRVKTIALAHGQIRHFYFGPVVDFLQNEDTKYAACFMQDTGATIDLEGKATSYGFKLFLLDLVHVSKDAKDNELDVQSDMMSVAEDMLAQFNDSQYQDWKVSLSNSVTFVKEELGDMVAGVVVDIDISTPYLKDTCITPVK